MSDTVEIKYNFETTDEWYSRQTVKDIDSWSDYYLDEFLVNKPDELSELDNNDIRILVRDSFWWMYRLYLNKPSLWDDNNLKYFICEHVPHDWVCEEGFPIESLTKLLVIFLKWLSFQGVISKQEKIIQTIIDSDDEFQNNLNNQNLWSMRKQLSNSINLKGLFSLTKRSKDKANRPADEEESLEMMSSFVKELGVNVDKSGLESVKKRSQQLRLATEDDLNNYPNAKLVVKQLNEIGYSHFPESELAAAIYYKDDIAPMLLDCLDDLIANKGIETYETTLFMYAFYLLGIFRDQRAYPKIVKIMQLDRDNELLGDLITTYDIKNIIASTYNNDISILDELIKDDDAYFYARGAAIESILALKTLGIIDQATLENKLDYYLNYKYSDIEQDQNEMITSVGHCILDSGSIDLLKKLQDLIIQNKINLDHYGLESIGEAVERTKNKVNRLDESSYYFIDDIKSTCGKWAMFHEQNDKLLTKSKQRDEKISKERSKKKIGRNDPCSCGSGKKYKKCCLLSQ